MIGPNPSDAEGVPESIVRDLADRWPVLYDASCAYCRFALPANWGVNKGLPDPNPDNHADACPWARARRWCAENLDT